MRSTGLNTLITFLLELCYGDLFFRNRLLCLEKVGFCLKLYWTSFLQYFAVAGAGVARTAGPSGGHIGCLPLWCSSGLG